MKYKAISIRVNNGEDVDDRITILLNSNSEKGWELFSINCFSGGGSEKYFIIFQKES
ncbi:MAG: DUF4177 domain-containing protein [bacterium]